MAVVFLLGLGCAAPGAKQPDKTGADSIAGSAPAPGPADEPWNATETGIGPVRVGMTVAEVEALLPMTTMGAADEPCHYRRPSGEHEEVAFMFTEGRVARVDVQGGTIGTSAGARIGDSEARIHELYSGRVDVTPHKYTEGHYLTVTPADSAYRIVFETDGKTVLRYRAGRLPEVRWVEGCS